MYKVTKKFLSLLLALILCLSTSQLTQAAEPPIPETPGTTDIGQPAPPINDGEPHGLILLTQTKHLTDVNADVVLQVYTIDPATGAQTLWSQFAKPSPDISFNYLLAGNIKGQLNANCTVFAANKPKAAVGEYGQDVNHGGWIDQSGQFFDVSNALGLDYTFALGFGETDDKFYFDVFEKLGMRGKYAIIQSVLCRGTIEGIKKGEYERVHVYSNPEIVEPNRYYLYHRDLFDGLKLVYSGANVSWELPATDYAEPGKNIVIADYHPHPDSPYFPIKNDTSILFDSVSGTLIHYLPDSYNTDNKSEWGGVLSPDGTTVAYLTVPGTSGQVSLEYTDISGFFASGFNPASRGVPTKMELADGPVKQATWNVYDYVTENPSCILLEWRE